VDDGAVVISGDLEVGYFEQSAVSGSKLSVYQEARARMTRINAASDALKAAEAACASEDTDEACRAADKYMVGHCSCRLSSCPVDPKLLLHAFNA